MSVASLPVADAMTRNRVEQIVEEWCVRLRLTSWDIRVRWHLLCDRECDAEIKISDDYEQASLRIQQIDDPESDIPCESFERWSERHANVTIVHELLHIFEKQTKRPLEQFIPEKPTPAHDMLWAWYLHGAENWVDRLALILVDLAGIQ